MLVKSFIWSLLQSTKLSAQLTWVVAYYLMPRAALRQVLRRYDHELISKLTAAGNIRCWVSGKMSLRENVRSPVPAAQLHIVISRHKRRHCSLLRATEECCARLSHRRGVRSFVRPSVRPSATLWYCVKQTQAKITKSSLWAAIRTLVYRDKISCPWMKGFPLNEGVKERYPKTDVILPILATPLKSGYFIAIGSFSVKTYADRQIHTAYYNKH